MKRIALILFGLILSANITLAATATLAWDASSSAGVVGYAIFARDYTHGYDYAQPIWKGTGLACTVTVPDDRSTAFVARAYGWGPYNLEGERQEIQSDNSNEVVFTPTVTKPEPPRNFLSKLIAAVMGFFGQYWA